MRFNINWRFLLKCCAAGLVLLVATHFTHRWQVRRQTGSFLREADLALKAGDSGREAAYLNRYLMARPDDTDARARLGRLLCRTAKSDKELMEGFLVVQDVLHRDPSRDELRRSAVDVAMDPRLGLYAEAIADIDVLGQKRPNDGELEGLKARCLARLNRYVDAGKLYETSLDHRPDLIDNYTSRATILRLKLNKSEEADGVVARMVQANPGNFRAHLLVAEYWRTFWGLGQSAGAAAKAVATTQKLKPEARVSEAIAAAVAEAQKLAPGELDVVLAVANVARFRSYDLTRAGKAEEAKAALGESYRTLKTGLAAHPREPKLYLALAALEAEQRQEKEPAAVIKDGLNAIPDSPELVLALLDYQIQAGDVEGATDTLGKLKGRGLPPTQADLQQGRILMLKGEWVEASVVLGHVQQDASNDPAVARPANLFLGRCYEQLGVLDRRLDAFRRAVPIDETDALWIPAMIGVAEAETALGKADAALQAYVKLRDRGVGSAFVQVARLMLVKAVTEAGGKKPDWAAAEAALVAAENVFPQEPDVRILRAGLLSLQGNPAEARKQLEALKAEKPKSVAVWLALAAEDQRNGSPAVALATLAAGEKEIGDVPALRLARARIWAETKEPELERKLEALAEVPPAYTPAERRALVRGLAELATAVTPGPLGGRLWDRFSELQPHDLGAHLTRFDLAVRAGDEGKMAGVLGEIRRVDGEAGSSARLARAVFLIWRAQKKNETAGLDEASVLLGGLEKERGGWARVALAQALVADLRGDTRAALEKYRAAVDQGETNTDALRRLLELLRTSGKFDEAVVVLRKLPAAAVEDGQALRLAAEVSLETNNFKDALAYADKAVMPASKNPADFVWQGKIYFRSGEPRRAEAAYRRAVELQPGNAGNQLVLIDFLVATNRIDEGQKVLDAAKEAVDKGERTLFLAIGSSLVRKPKEATEAFKQARAERPTDLRTLRAEAEFLLESGQLKDARDAFRRVIALQTAPAADKEFARQMLGICLAADRDPVTSRTALHELGLLDGGRLRPPTGNETPAERRGRIAVLALQRDRDSRLEAIRLLEADRAALPANDQFLLAQLYRSVGDRAQVRVVMSGLLRKNDRVALYVRFYAAWLLQVGDAAAADEWVAQLTKLQPDALTTAEVRARSAAAKGNLSAARTLIVPRADEPGAPVMAIAQVCESIKLYADAEALLKRVVDKTREQQPQAPLALAAFYGRRGRTAEALRICDAVRKTVPAAAVGGTAVGVLYDAPAPKAADADSVAGWLDEAARKATGEPKAALVQLLASVRNLQGDYAESQRLYRDALATNPGDVLAMNNLAFLISTKEGKHDEALALLQRAKDAGGPAPDLLDTEALVRLNKNEAATARRLLATVVAEAPSGAAYYHLARAELAAGGKLEARVAWQQAEERGVKPADLHPLERQEFDRVSRLLK